MPDAIPGYYGGVRPTGQLPTQGERLLARWSVTDLLDDRAWLSGFLSLNQRNRLRIWLDDGDGRLERDTDVVAVNQLIKDPAQLEQLLASKGKGFLRFNRGFSKVDLELGLGIVSLDTQARRLRTALGQPTYSDNPKSPSELKFQRRSRDLWPGSRRDGLPELIIADSMGGKVAQSADYVTFRVPAGHEVSRFELNKYYSGSGDQKAFIALQRGSISTASAENPEALLGWTHFGPLQDGARRGQDLLAALGGSLRPGRYTAWIQQLGGKTEYGFRLQASLLSGKPTNGARPMLHATPERDILTGHVRQSDVFTFAKLTDSLLGDEDTINGFEGIDKIRVAGRSYQASLEPSLPLNPTPENPFGRLKSLSPDAVTSFLSADVFPANAALAFTDDHSRNFLALNDDRPGFQVDSDAFLRLKLSTVVGVQQISVV